MTLFQSAWKCAVAAGALWDGHGLRASIPRRTRHRHSQQQRSIDVAGANKTTHFIQLMCRPGHPIIYAPRFLFSVFYTSGLALDDGVIDPRDTRAVLAQCLDICAQAEARRLRPLQFGVARM